MFSGKSYRVKTYVLVSIKLIVFIRLSYSVKRKEMETYRFFFASFPAFLAWSKKYIGS